MDTGTVTQTAGQGAADFLTVLFAWMFTPTGAVLTLLLLAVGGGSVFMKIMGRSMRMLSVAARICAGLFFVWVISGVLESPIPLKTAPKTLYATIKTEPAPHILIYIAVCSKASSGA